MLNKNKIETDNLKDKIDKIETNPIYKSIANGRLDFYPNKYDFNNYRPDSLNHTRVNSPTKDNRNGMLSNRESPDNNILNPKINYPEIKSDLIDYNNLKWWA